MFNLPVISNNCRYSPDSSGMMHLNALNGSFSSSQRGLSSCSNCLPSYEEAISNGPLFGLFNVNGGDSSHHHHHHHHYHHHHDCHNNNSHIQFPQSYHSPNNNEPYSPPTYQEILSPTGSGSGNESKSPNSRSNSRFGSSSRDDNAAERLDVEIQGERLSHVTFMDSPKIHVSKPVPKSPRLHTRNTEKKQAVPPCTSKNGNGSGEWRKQGGVERSALSAAKDRLCRVFSPMLIRKQNRHRSSSAKPRSGKTIQSTGDDYSDDEENVTSLPLRVCLSPPRPRSSRSDHFDDISGSNTTKQHKSKHHRHQRGHKNKSNK